MAFPDIQLADNTPGLAFDPSAAGATPDYARLAAMRAGPQPNVSVPNPLSALAINVGGGAPAPMPVANPTPVVPATAPQGALSPTAGGVPDWLMPQPAAAAQPTPTVTRTGMSVRATRGAPGTTTPTTAGNIAFPQASGIQPLDLVKIGADAANKLGLKAKDIEHLDDRDRAYLMMQLGTHIIQAGQSGQGVLGSLAAGAQSAGDSYQQMIAQKRQIAQQQLENERQARGDAQQQAIAQQQQNMLPYNQRVAAAQFQLQQQKEQDLNRYRDLMARAANTKASAYAAHFNSVRQLGAVGIPPQLASSLVLKAHQVLSDPTAQASQNYGQGRSYNQLSSDEQERARTAWAADVARKSLGISMASGYRGQPSTQNSIFMDGGDTGGDMGALSDTGE